METREAKDEKVRISPKRELRVPLLQPVGLSSPQMVPTFTPLFIVSPTQLAKIVPEKGFLDSNLGPSVSPGW